MNDAPRYIAYHMSGGYRRKEKWLICDSHDTRTSNPPFAIAVCYEETSCDLIIEALNHSEVSAPYEHE